MNPYIEEYSVIKRRLNTKGNSLAARLARVEKAARETNDTIGVLMFLFSLVLCGTWLWLLFTENPFLRNLYEATNHKLPDWLAMLLLYDLMPLVWLVMVGSTIGYLLGVVMVRQSIAKVDRVRSRIVSAYPLLSEAIQMCKQQHH